MIKQEFYTLNGRDYRIDFYTDRGSWSAYRKTSWGAYKRIPCFTRSEEARFPMSVARLATQRLAQIMEVSA